MGTHELSDLTARGDGGSDAAPPSLSGPEGWSSSTPQEPYGYGYGRYHCQKKLWSDAFKLFSFAVPCVVL
jgi:hypothetical protein